MNKENVGEQFNCDMCGKPLYSDKGYTPHPECEDRRQAKQDILTDVGLEQLQRLQHFPSNWVSYDPEQGYHIRYTSPKGWLHTMNPSEPSIRHYDSGDDTKIGAVTHLWDDSVAPHLQKYKSGLTTEEFLKHTNAAENHFGDTSIVDHPDGFNW